MRGHMRIFVIGMIALAIFMTLIGTVESTDWIVDDDPHSNRDFRYIQDAINASSSGDNIKIYNGTYREHLTVNTRVYIQGNGTDQTFIIGRGDADAIIVTADECVFWMLNITPGSGLNLTGIYVYRSDDVEILDCSIHHCMMGVYYYESSHPWTEDLVLYDNSGDGIKIHYSPYWFVDSASIWDNGGFGAYSAGSSNGTMVNTDFVRDGLYIDGNINDTTSHWIEDNTVNGRPLYFINNTQQASIPKNQGQYILANADFDYIVDTVITDTDVGILLIHSSRIGIRRVEIFNVMTGVIFDRTTESNITNSGINDTTDCGIKVLASTHCFIENTTINDTTDGIKVDGETFTEVLNRTSGYSIYYEGHHLLINDCHIFNLSDDGIDVHTMNYTLINYTRINNTYGNGILIHENTHNSSIYRCAILNVSDDGILLFNEVSNNTVARCDVSNCSGRGIVMTTDANSNNITNCSVHNNTNPGIMVLSSDYNNITYNNIWGNGNYGVSLLGAFGTRVHHNNFDANGAGTSQGNDNNGLNHWDQGGEGNYWDDYGGTDGNGDGIGDTAYDIDGAGNDTDDYPLMDPGDTSAPRKIAEFTILVTISITLFALLAIGKRTR